MDRESGGALSAAAQRLRAQLLSGPPGKDPVAVVRQLLAIQAQDPKGARLAVRARTSDRAAEDLDRELTAERSLLITWLNRGTLHLVRSEDYHWLHALTTPPLFTGNARRLAQEGVEPAAAERAVEIVRRALAADGPLTRFQLRDRIAAAGIKVEGQALVHIMVLATLRGLIIRGPMIGRQHAYALVADWIGVQPAVERDRALAELARRYLVGHAPADERDLAKWAGIPLRDARAGFAAIADQLQRRRDGLFALRGTRSATALPAPRLLGPFEPVLLGWSSREFIVQGHLDAIVSGGVFRPFALVDGRAVAVWGIRDGKVWIEPFTTLDPSALTALEIDAEDVIRYLGS